MPDISVVIPSYNASADLRRCLDALLSSAFDLRCVEIIVVDDGSIDGTEGAVAAFVAAHAVPEIRYHRRDRTKAFGPGIARAEGIAMARGAVIACTDADCIPDRDWLAAVARAVIERKLPLVGGTVWCDEVLLFPWRMAPAGHRGVTANLAFDRMRLSAVPFSDGFSGVVGDDVDFTMRAEEAGIPMTDDPAMRVQHPSRSVAFGAVLRRTIWRKNEVLLVRRHGEKVMGAISPFFRPLPHVRVSPATFVAIAECALLLCVPARPRIALSIIGACAALFLAFGYRFAIAYSPASRPRVTLAERLRTLVCIAAYLPCFVWSRIVGSVEFRRFML